MLKKALPHLISVLVLLSFNVIYFFPQIEGKVVQQSDIVSSDQKTKSVKEYSKANGKSYLWNPAQFGGMPLLANPPSKNNLVYKFYTVLKFGFSEPIGMFFAGSLLMYLCFILMGFSPWVSLIFAIPTMFVTGNLILWEAGHNSKLRTILFTPLLIAGVLNIFEYRKYFLGFILLASGFAFSFFTRHPQMTFYILLVFMIYGFIVLVSTIKNKDWMHFGKGTLLVFVAILLGLATSATKTWSMYDYSKVTMRGDHILIKDNPEDESSSSKVDGLAWDYATQWSNGFTDIMAIAIPGFAGGGTGEKVGKSSASYKNYRMNNAPLYWGKLPFTVGPLYLGVSVLFLFVLGLFIVKGNLKWWLGIGMIWMILLSMGKHFEILNRLMFEYFPFYSKFRAPQTVLNVSSFFVVLLSASAVQQLFSISRTKQAKTKNRSPHSYEKPLLICTAICGGITLLIALVGASFFDFSYLSDPAYQQQGINIDHLIADRKALFRGDSFRSLIIILLLAGIVYAYLKEKLSKYLMLAFIGLIIVFDLVGIGWRYLDHDKFVRKQTYKQNFVERGVDTQIKSVEPNLHNYRVHDMTISSFQSASASAYHNTIGGYDPVKMQRAADLIEIHLQTNNGINVFNMLNTKYFITPGEDRQPVVQANPGALGVGWFVSNIKFVNTPNEEINALAGTDLGSTAVVLQSEFPNYLSSTAVGVNPQGSISITNFEPDRIVYSSTSQKEGLAVFSEMWYGPDKGWTAYIDGKATDHIRVNYALRGLLIPAGTHEVVFEFKPKSYYVGETISLIASLILIGLILWFVYDSYKKYGTTTVVNS